METTEWTKLTLKGRSEDVEILSAVMSMLDEGLMIEDYSDLSGDSPFGEVVSEELAARDREAAAVSVFLPTERVTPDLLSFVPKPEDIPLMDTNPAAVRANAYDMVINGVEVGGGSIRIHDAALQTKN